jgi:hypothetical protein
MMWLDIVQKGQSYGEQGRKKKMKQRVLEEE